MKTVVQQQQKPEISDFVHTALNKHEQQKKKQIHQQYDY